MRSLSILRPALVAAAVLSGSMTAESAEDPARLDLSVGFAFLWNQNGEPTTLPLGLAGGVGFNPTSSLGLVADAGVSYSEGTDVASEAAYLGGLRYTFHRSGLVPYVEALGGGTRRSVTTSGATVSAWDSAVQVGTGVLFRIRPDKYLRASADFRSVFGEGVSSQRFRFLFGATLGLRRSDGGGAALNASSRAAGPVPTAAPSAAAPSQGPTPESAASTSSGPSPSSNIVQFPSQPPATPTPTPRVPSPLAPAAPSGRSLPEGLAQGAELLRSGRYADASASFQDALRAHAAHAFTVAIGLFCEEHNVAQLVNGAGDSEPLLVVASLRGRRTCYGVYWGVFASTGEAQRALGSIPAALRASGQAPCAVSRLLR